MIYAIITILIRRRLSTFALGNNQIRHSNLNEPHWPLGLSGVSRSRCKGYIPVTKPEGIPIVSSLRTPPALKNLSGRKGFVSGDRNFIPHDCPRYAIKITWSWLEKLYLPNVRYHQFTCTIHRRITLLPSGREVTFWKIESIIRVFCNRCMRHSLWENKSPCFSEKAST